VQALREPHPTRARSVETSRRLDDVRRSCTSKALRTATRASYGVALSAPASLVASRCPKRRALVRLRAALLAGLDDLGTELGRDGDGLLVRVDRRMIGARYPSPVGAAPVRMRDLAVLAPRTARAVDSDVMRAGAPVLVQPKHRPPKLRSAPVAALAWRNVRPPTIDGQRTDRVFL